MMRPALAMSVLGLGLSACGANEPSAGRQPPELPLLVAAANESPERARLGVSREARTAEKDYVVGHRTAVWTYNGSVPGPLLDANVGTELAVHFKNDLPEETTIHWHGVRLPAGMDGTLRMQEPVPPGGAFDYRFVLKDPGLFWLHPHVRSDEQIEKGLYGVIRVNGSDEPRSDQETILVLDDVNVLPDGSLPSYLDDESQMLGRQGNTLLVNGVSSPVFRWRTGSLQRFRIVNVANGRFFNLALPGYSWRVIGTDGGLVPEPYDTDRLLLSPGERYDVMLVVRGAPGERVTLMNEPYERGHDTGDDAPLPVADFVVTNEQAFTDRELPTSLPVIERLPDGDVDQTLVLNEGLREGELLFTINDETFPDVPLIDVAAGSVQRFLVRNDSEMDHPFHLHGTFFQVLAAGDVATPAERLANKDTVIVPQRSSLKLVARFDEPGGWMYHCHILEHAEGGMMGEIDVEARRSSRAAPAKDRRRSWPSLEVAARKPLPTR
jgi:FtsP/CotA-like multicopper oxidase with cupredoxin domain